MTIAVSQINATAGADSFTILYQRFNQIANAMSTQVLTSAANSTGGVTSGNVQLSGIFGSTMLVSTTLRGGNVSSSNTLSLISNLAVTGEVFYVGNSSVNTTINSTAIVVNTAVVANLTVTALTLQDRISVGSYTDSYFTASTSNTSNQVIDSFDFSVFRSAEYFLQIKDNATGDYQVSKVLVTSDGVDAYMTEYGMVTSNTIIGVFSTSANSSSAVLAFLPGSASCTIKGHRKAMGIIS